MALQQLLLDLGIRADLSIMSRIRTGLLNVNKTALIAAAGIAATGLALAKMFSIGNEIKELGDNIDKMSKAIGINVEALQELRFAADLAGLKNAEFDKGLQSLQKNMFEAGRGSAAYKEMFDRLGVSVKDGKGELKDADLVFMEVIEGMGELTSETEKSALAQNLFGRAGKKMGALIAGGSEEIMKARKEARELGIIMGEDLVKASAELNDNQTRMSMAWLGIKIQIGRVVIPLMDKLTRIFIKVFKAISSTTRGTKIFKVVLIGLVAGLGIFLATLTVVAAKAAVLWAIANAPLLLAAALVLAFILVLEDLWTFLQGGDSVIGDIADAFADWLMESDSMIAVVLRAIVDFFVAVVDGIAWVIQKGADFIAFLISIPGIVIDAIKGAAAAIAGIATNMFNAFMGAINRIKGALGGLLTDLTDAIGLTSVAEDEEMVRKGVERITARQSAASQKKQATEGRRVAAFKQLEQEGFGTFQARGRGQSSSGFAVRDAAIEGQAQKRLEQILNQEVNVTVDASNADNPQAVGNAVGAAVKDTINLRQAGANFQVEAP